MGHPGENTLDEGPWWCGRALSTLTARPKLRPGRSVAGSSLRVFRDLYEALVNLSTVHYSSESSAGVLCLKYHAVLCFNTNNVTLFALISAIQTNFHSRSN